MSSFFEKLKKGMGVEEPIIEEEPKEEEKAETPTETKTSKKPKKLKESRGEEDKSSSSPSSRKRDSVKEDKTSEFKIKKLEIKTETPEEKEVENEVEEEPKEQKEREWPSFGGEEGQLTIDVYQTENDLVIQSAIAGVKPESLDISIERDIITIKGGREKPLEENGDYFVQECFWGPFSREVIVPTEVDPSRAEASLKEGILTIRIPKIQREKKKKITIKG